MLTLVAWVTISVFEKSVPHKTIKMSKKQQKQQKQQKKKKTTPPQRRLSTRQRSRTAKGLFYDKVKHLNDDVEIPSTPVPTLKNHEDQAESTPAAVSVQTPRPRKSTSFPPLESKSDNANNLELTATNEYIPNPVGLVEESVIVPIILKEKELEFDCVTIEDEVPITSEVEATGDVEVVTVSPDRDQVIGVEHVETRSELPESANKLTSVDRHETADQVPGSENEETRDQLPGSENEEKEKEVPFAVNVDDVFEPVQSVGDEDLHSGEEDIHCEIVSKLQNELIEKEKQIKEQGEKMKILNDILMGKLDELKIEKDKVINLQNNNTYRKRVVELEGVIEEEEMKTRRMEEELNCANKLLVELRVNSDEQSKTVQQYEKKCEGYVQLVGRLEEKIRTLEGAMAANLQLEGKCCDQQMQILELEGKVRKLEESLSFHLDEKVKLQNKLKIKPHDQTPGELDNLRNEFESFKRFTLEQFNNLHLMRLSSSSDSSSDCSSSEEEAEQSRLRAQQDVKQQLQAHKHSTRHDTTPPPQSPASEHSNRFTRRNTTPSSITSKHSNRSISVVSQEEESNTQTSANTAGHTRTTSSNRNISTTGVQIRNIDRGLHDMKNIARNGSSATALEDVNRFCSLRFNSNNPLLPESPTEDNVDLNGGVQRGLRVVPGPRNYSDVTKNGEETLVMSNSITKGIRVWELNEHFAGEGAISFRRFPGGKAHHIKRYLPIHLEEVAPKSVIIQSGGNDLPASRGLPPTPLNDIVTTIKESAEICKQFGVKSVFIGGVPIRKKRYVQDRCHELNAQLEAMCVEHGFIFIDNSNITTDHLYQDGVHLSNEGSDLLANNYLWYLNGRHWELVNCSSDVPCRD